MKWRLLHGGCSVAYVDDALRARAWVDLEDSQPFVANILTILPPLGSASFDSKPSGLKRRYEDDGLQKQVGRPHCAAH